MNLIWIADSLGERALTALKDSLLGMCVVFAALIILWAVIEIFHACVVAFSKKKKSESQVENEPAPVLVSENEEVETNSEEEAVVAAITAALSVVLEQPVGSFRVVSFKRSPQNAHWNRK
jgi:sodium pump decarboxylase gamma subunit